ncbi:sensor histidine kinase [Lysobacter fragariae]
MNAWRIVLIAVLLALSPSSARAQAPSSDASGVQTFAQAQAVRGTWDSYTPPATGWEPVKLMDVWTTRWPKHDGVVWYRVRWNQADAAQPTAVLLDYACLARAVYVNGSLVVRDPSLVEPLSRSWVKPTYLLLSPPLLRNGENTLLVRVSGLAAYQPGLGPVKVGDPARLDAAYREGVFVRRDVYLAQIAISLALGSLFLMLWLLRRKDTTYGWYAVNALAWMLYRWNFVAEDIRPFASTDAWQAFVAAMFLASSSAFTVFLLRYMDLRWPRRERALLLVNLAAIAMAVFAPSSMGPGRDPWIMLAAAIYYGTSVWFLWAAARSGRRDCQVMAACLLIPMLTSIHDLLVFFDVVRSSRFLMVFSVPLSLLSMGFVLAYRFAAAMRRVEGFNQELKAEVESATAQLKQTLVREHQLDLSNTRNEERLNMVRDLHDGFGGSLLATISALDNAAADETSKAPSARDVSTRLKELRDDLRLVIDTTTHDQDMDLADMLAMLRHRWNSRLDASGIDGYWHLLGLDGLRFGPARSLEVLRLLQEALTNVLKHSGASRVDVTIEAIDDQLRIEVRDDGRGFDPQTAHRTMTGAGMGSLHARALRLGGRLSIHSTPGQGTSLQLVPA